MSRITIGSCIAKYGGSGSAAVADVLMFGRIFGWARTNPAPHLV